MNYFILHNHIDLFLHEPFCSHTDNDVIPVLWRNRVTENECPWHVGGRTDLKTIVDIAFKQTILPANWLFYFFFRMKNIEKKKS